MEYSELFDADDGTLKPAAELTTLLGARGITPVATVVTYGRGRAGLAASQPDTQVDR